MDVLVLDFLESFMLSTDVDVSIYLKLFNFNTNIILKKKQI